MTHLKSGRNQRENWKKFSCPSTNTSIIISTEISNTIYGNFIYDDLEQLCFVFGLFNLPILVSSLYSFLEIFTLYYTN